MRAASTYRAARRNADRVLLASDRRPNLQGPFPYVEPAATLLSWSALRTIRELGREFRNMRTGEGK